MGEVRRVVINKDETYDVVLRTAAGDKVVHISDYPDIVAQLTPSQVAEVMARMFGLGE